MENTYSKDRYLKYLQSSDWLIKKSRLVMSYLRKKLPICCSLCGSMYNLQVHHRTYKNLYKERLCDLEFLCKECHSLSYSNKEKFNKKYIENIISIVEYLNIK